MSWVCDGEVSWLIDFTLHLAFLLFPETSLNPLVLLRPCMLHQAGGDELWRATQDPSGLPEQGPRLCFQGSRWVLVLEQTFAAMSVQKAAVETSGASC